MRERAQFWEEYNSWFKNLKAGQQGIVAVKIGTESSINDKTFNATIVSIEGSRIITKIGRRRVVFMLSND